MLAHVLSVAAVVIFIINYAMNGVSVNKADNQ